MIFKRRKSTFYLRIRQFALMYFIAIKGMQISRLEELYKNIFRFIY